MSAREYLLHGPLGFGAAPLGNMFRNIPDAEAEATVDAAWQQGTRYFDTAPFYGASSATTSGSVPRWAGSSLTRLTRQPEISARKAIFSNTDGQSRSFTTTPKRER